MATSEKKIRRLLAEAQEAKLPVVVYRGDVDNFRTDGYVIGLARDWVILHEVRDGVHLDGITMLRIDLVTDLESGNRVSTYIHQGTTGLGERPSPLRCDPDASVSDLLRMAADSAELAMIHLEELKHEPREVGRIRGIGKSKLRLQCITRAGVWQGEVEELKLSDITAIEFGSRYLRGLERFGDPRPT